MVTYDDCRQLDEHALKGLSDDDKPLEGIAINSTFWELDTNAHYYFDGEDWLLIGGDANANSDQE